jgi:L-ascorbate metabolism protein UlaG (beta-lactamase superfamily)
MAVEIEFLGHATFLIRGGKETVLIDPFLTDNPKASRKADEIECTRIVISHGHSDHMADAGPIAKRTGATVYAAYEICGYLGETYGLENLEPMNPGGCVPFEGGSVRLVQAFHSSSFEGRYMGMPCGIILGLDGKTIYHTGDTALFSDMKFLGMTYKPDALLVCAGDRFTMGPREAAHAAEWIGAPVAVPMHYATWPLLAGDMDAFTPTGVRTCLLEPGEVLTLD